MADVLTYDGIINNLSNDRMGYQTFYEYVSATLTALVSSTSSLGTLARDTVATKVLPSPLPGSITKYRPLYTTAAYANAGPAQASYLICKAVNLGSFNIGTNTFTDGSAMPTRTELNTASSQTYGPIFATVTTAFSGTVTTATITITYKNASGTGGQTLAFSPTTSIPSVGAGVIFQTLGTNGVEDITACSVAGGTSPTGVLKFWGLLPLGIFTTTAATTNMGYNFLTQGFNFMELGAGDQIKMIQISALTAGATVGQMWFMGEV